MYNKYVIWDYNKIRYISINRRIVMNLYIRAIGFQYLDADFEEEMIHAGILDSIEKGFVIKNTKLNRGAVIVRVSESTGLYIYGRFKGDEFIYEYYFPFILGKTSCDNDEITIERHLDKESFAVVCDESRTGVTLIFYLQNVMDYLEFIFDKNGLKQKEYNIDRKGSVYRIPIKNKKVSLTALSIGGMILLPSHRKVEPVKAKKEQDERGKLIQAAKKGDETAIENLTIEDIDTYNELSQRILKEDVFSIVDSSFMPCGVECDQYQVVGEILELEEEINHYTKETVYIMVIECNNLSMTVAVNKADLLGEPAVGRRFKGQVWLQGSVAFKG